MARLLPSFQPFPTPWFRLRVQLKSNSFPVMFFIDFEVAQTHTFAAKF
jgi:hypothetical protein